MKKMKKKLSFPRIVPALIILSVLFMCIGYASINSISMDIRGDVIAEGQDGIFITKGVYKSDVDADVNNSKIVNMYQALFESNIELSSSNPNSSITYQISIYNSNSVAYAFDKVDYLLGDDTYSNEDIIFSIEGLDKGDVINSGETITFNITFRYNEGILSDNSVLKSLLNFKFEYVTSPVLASNMVPVIYENNSWKKIDSSSKNWHSYLNGKWANAITYNHNLVYNEVANKTEGKKFNGNGDHVNIGFANYDFGKNITVVVRAKLADIPSSAYIMLGNPELAGFQIAKRANNTFSFFVYRTNDYLSVNSNFVAKPDVWYTIVGTYDGNAIKLYVDGVLNNSIAYSGSIPVSKAPIAIGANPNDDGTMASTEYFKGTISDVIIMKDTLDASEIAQNYGKTLHHNPTKHNVLYYTKFDGDNGYVNNSASYENEGMFFDGVDDYVSIGYSMYDFKNSFTVATRIKILGKLDETTTIVGNQQQSGFSLYKTKNNKLKIGIFDSNLNGYQEVEYDYDVDSNAWYTVVATFNGSSLCLYINGELVDSLSGVMDMKISNVPIMLGVNPNIGSTMDNEYLNAIVSDLMIIDEALTSNQIRTYYSDNLRTIISDKTLISYDLRNYESREEDSIIPDDMINAMWVWIPKFNAVNPNGPGQIDVEIVSPVESGHDAFDFSNNQLEGFWVGKFENSSDVSYENGNINVCSNILIKPNYISLANKNIGETFKQISNISSLTDIYGFGNSIDTHLIKNSEWGAVAYLAQSKYGLCMTGTCKELANNGTTYITGGSNYLTNTIQSTTQNVYGIYDLNGGVEEFVMGNYNNTLNSLDGFVALPNEKYMNIYTTSDVYLSNKLQHGLVETNGLFNNGAGNFVSSSNVWLRRNNLFSYNNSNGEASNSVGSRTVLIVK